MSKKNNKAKQFNQTKTVKSLCSYIYHPPKEFKSIFPCKHKPNTAHPFSPGKNREKFYLMGVNGPLIVTHNTIGKKIKPKPRRNHFDDLVKVKPYSYFQQHKYCEETQHYWLDPKHPKIFRHYSNEDKKRLLTFR